MSDARSKASRAYWEERFEHGDSLRAVGDRSHGDVYNAWVYRGLRHAMARALRRAHVHLRGRSLCDVGMGLGAWLAFWEKAGASPIVGIDIAGVAVDRMRSRWPSLTFHRADLAEASELAVPELGGRGFDAVAAVNVLYHFESDDAFDRALENVLSLMRPGGWLIVTDGMADDERPVGTGERSRSLASYAKSLRAHAVYPVLVQPLSFTLCGPLVVATPAQRIEASVHRLAARVVRRCVRRANVERLNDLIGAFLYVVDAVLLPFARRGPTLHVLIARKDDA